MKTVTRRSSWTARPVLAIIFALLVAGCSGANDVDEAEGPEATDTDTAGAAGTDGEDESPQDDETSQPEVRSIVLQPAVESFSHLPYLVVLVEELFEAEGLDVTYNSLLPNAAQVAQFVASGDADIGLTGTTGTLAVGAAGRDVVSIGSQASQPSSLLTLRTDVVDTLDVGTDAPIDEKINALEGLTIATPAAGSSTDVLLRSTLSEYGLNPDSDITLQPVGDMGALVAAAREGQVDGLIMSPPVSTVGIGEGWGTQWVSWPAGEVPAFAGVPWSDIASSQAFIQEDPEAVRRVLRAFWEAARILRDEPDSVRDSIKDEFYADLDRDVYDASFDAMVPSFTDGLVAPEDSFDALLMLANAGADEEIEYSYEELFHHDLARETRPVDW